VVPVHTEGWTHFTENIDDLLVSFTARVNSDVLEMIEPGDTAVV
jgi:hypothetical protein